MGHEKQAERGRDVLAEVYSEAVDRAGGIPVLLPNRQNAAALTACDALLLTGGGDFDPVWFGQANHGTPLGAISPERDRTELALIRAALSRNMPVLGICRGMQALAIASGGTLIQDLAERQGLPHFQTESRETPTHRVRIAATSRLGKLLEVPEIWVNSFHHQAVESVGSGWTVSATSDDGLIEALEWSGDPVDRWIIGVQWHPEDLSGANDPAAQAIFSDFLMAVERRR